MRGSFGACLRYTWRSCFFFRINNPLFDTIALVIISRSSIFCPRFDFLSNLFRPTGLYGPRHTITKVTACWKFPLKLASWLSSLYNISCTRYHVRITRTLSFFLYNWHYIPRSIRSNRTSGYYYYPRRIAISFLYCRSLQCTGNTMWTTSHLSISSIIQFSY